MEDRFKFRVWDKEGNKMFTPTRHFNYSIVNGTIICVESYCHYDGFYKKRIIKEFDDAVLMQCTGLKDKNGKLIYEGDIVKSDFDFITNTINPLRFNIGNVIYSDYIAGFVIASDINDYSPYKTSFFGKTEALNCIVIGNLYQNPELLED